MKKAKYHTTDGMVEIEYDENAACIICGEPVVEASTSGTAICPWCDCGGCRYCGMPIFILQKNMDGGKSQREFVEHIQRCKVKGENENGGKNEKTQAVCGF